MVKATARYIATTLLVLSPAALGGGRAWATPPLVPPSAPVPSTTGGAAAAAAAPGEDPRATQARQACLSGNVDAGIRLLEDYLRSTGDPTAIFNMGRCFQFNHQPDSALARFREYLKRAGDLPPAEKRLVTDHIRQLEDEQRAKAGSGTGAATPGTSGAAGVGPRTPPHAGIAGAGPPAAPAPLPAPPPTAATGIAAAPAATAPAADASGTAPPVPETSASDLRRSRLRKAGLVTGAAGAAAVAAGLVFGLRVRAANADLARELEKESPDAGAYNDHFTRGQTAERWQWALLGVGAATLATGTVLYLLGRPSAEQRRTAFAAWAAPGGAGATWEGAF